MYKRIILLLLAVSLIILASGCQAGAYEPHPFVQQIAKKITPLDYQEILETGVKPALDPGFDFPISYQYENGCFAFAVNHILEYKFNKKLDLYEAEKIIKKPRYVLWDVDYITAFLNEYDIEMIWYKDAETFFKLLEEGEPIVMQYPYKVPGDRYIGHLVAVYSFDNEGVWVSDSISGKHIRIEYPLVFNRSNKYTRYGFATVLLDE